MHQPLLAISGISKSFAGNPALSDISFTIEAGEIHALVGENGAGKSTLMKILAGVHQPDAGTVTFDGQSLDVKVPRHAKDKGIITIYQELNLLPKLSLAENILLGTEPMRGAVIDWKRMHTQARDLLRRVGLDLDPRTPVEQLGIGQQQLIEIAKALHHQAKLLILDEPTAALSTTETRLLFELMRQLQRDGVSMIFISHHLDEVLDVCSRVTVLRDGQCVTTIPVDGLSEHDLVRLMVGRAIEEQYPKERHVRPDVLLSIRNLTRRDEKIRDLSIDVHAGEVLGIGGLIGAGRTELLRALFGVDPVAQGEVTIAGLPYRPRDPRHAIRSGIGFITEDRKNEGLVLGMSVRHNLSLTVLDKLSAGPLITHRREQELADTYVRDVRIKTASQHAPVSSLSGGNQQKVALSKWLATHPKVVLLDEPTRGVDVGAKVEIYQLINQLTRGGAAVVMVSSDMPELLGLSDRVLVLRGGTVQGVLSGDKATQENVLTLASGLTLSDNGARQDMLASHA